MASNDHYPGRAKPNTKTRKNENHEKDRKKTYCFFLSFSWFSFFRVFVFPLPALGHAEGKVPGQGTWQG
jgi:hypothetical protein